MREDAGCSPARPRRRRLRGVSWPWSLLRRELDRAAGRTARRRKLAQRPPGAAYDTRHADAARPAPPRALPEEARVVARRARRTGLDPARPAPEADRRLRRALRRGPRGG